MDTSPCPAEEPIEAVAARVRRKLVVMGLALLGIPLLYAVSLRIAGDRALNVAECLPPGIGLESPLAERPGLTVAHALTEFEARVVNGVLVDRDGQPIAFERVGVGTPRARDPRLRVIPVADPAPKP